MKKRSATGTTRVFNPKENIFDNSSPVQFSIFEQFFKILNVDLLNIIRTPISVAIFLTKYMSKEKFSDRLDASKIHFLGFYLWHVV